MGAKIHGATGTVVIGGPGVVAIDAGNLLAVSKVVRRLAPGAKLILIADDDRKNDQVVNPGLDAARAAAWWYSRTWAERRMLGTC
ncbi:MAG: hypothetical protein KKC76_16950 [Proteobacteria bacterium]|nr:hypothetical protein [Pseudomonadota bacterium]MCG2749829.1 hypothetical protein [Desulfobulbaceae bacterium]